MSCLSRRSFLNMLPAAAATASAQTRGKRPPNVLLMMADDFGFECLGSYGGTSYKTPNLDRMAKNGVRFTHAYAQPLCTPTRVQLMTGQHNFRNWKAFGLIDPNEKTFGHVMQKAGYRTGIMGKWQFYSYEFPGSPRYAKGMKPEQSGFDEWLLWHDGLTEKKGSRYASPVLNENGKMRTDTNGKYGPDLEVDFLTGFMERNKEKPFFAYYAMTLTHGPFNPTPKSADWAHGNRLKDDPKYFGDMVEYLDDTVGRIFEYLDRSGLSENTLVLFYGDNGTPQEVTSRLGSQVIKGGKGLTIDSGIHVPLIARWPGVAAEGKVCADLVDSTDFLPTMLEATGAKGLEGMPLDGRSFLPQVKGKKGNPRSWAFAHYDPHPGQRVNYPPTRYTWDHRHKLYMDGRLFDWAKDPLEKSPIADAGASAADRAARRKLQAGLDQMAKVKAPKFNPYETDGGKSY
ncbi:MAG: sulfatase-like hydrolase/transferase [Bryobacterales bacterium]|nr:sulfatase-like hydrolase/transferase [Bryobacterales bacterium]